MVYEDLTRRGLAGGMRSARCSPRQINLAIDRTVPYSLVVVGDVFVGRGHAASQRLTRELSAQLGDALRVPVVRAEDLEARVFLGPWQLARLAVFAAVVALLYVLVFSNQRPLLEFFAQEGGIGRYVAAGVLLLFIPTFAYIYGNVAKSLLRLVKIE
jgi:hypothetical protein